MFWSICCTVAVLLGTEAGDAIEIPFGRYGLPLVLLLLIALILATPFTLIARSLLDAVPLCLLGILYYGIYIYYLPCLNALDQYLRGQGIDAAEHPPMFGGGSLALTLTSATLVLSGD